MRGQVRQGERAESNIELLLWIGAAFAVIGIAAYIVFMEPWKKDPIELTPEQQAYVQAIATQQADAYIRAVATQQASAPPPASAPEPAQQTSYQAPSQPAAQPTQKPAAPPPAQPPPQQPPPAPAPPPTATPQPPPPPPPAPPPPAPPPPAPSGFGKTTLGACVGYMAGFSSTGYDQCVQIVQGSDYDLALCVGHIIGSPGIEDGKGACTRVAMRGTDAYLADCLLGLTGQSYWGYTSCRIYWETH